MITLIEDHPFAGRARNEVRPGLRSFPATPHVVFYRVANNTAQVVRVLDGRQDIEEKFASRDGESQLKSVARMKRSEIRERLIGCLGFRRVSLSPRLLNI